MIDRRSCVWIPGGGSWMCIIFTKLLWHSFRKIALKTSMFNLNISNLPFVYMLEVLSRKLWTMAYASWNSSVSFIYILERIVTRRMTYTYVTKPLNLICRYCRGSKMSLNPSQVIRQLGHRISNGSSIPIRVNENHRTSLNRTPWTGPCGGVHTFTCTHFI